MNLDPRVTARFFLNLDRREDRRIRTERVFRDLGLEAERFPAVDGRNYAPTRHWTTPGRRCVATSFKLMIREAEKRGANQVEIFEDDLGVHPLFEIMASKINLPDDWDMFYFGGMHYVEPIPVDGVIVKARRMVGNHAIIIRDRAFRTVRRTISKAIDRHGADKDIRIAALQMEHLNVYAPAINLIWQIPDYSDLMLNRVQYFRPDGQQNQQPRPYTPTV